MSTGNRKDALEYAIVYHMKDANEVTAAAHTVVESMADFGRRE